MPATEEDVPVPVPPGAVKLRMVLPVNVAIELVTKIPTTCVPAVAAAAILCKEFTKFSERFVATVDEVFTLSPKTLAAPVLVLAAVILKRTLLF